MKKILIYSICFILLIFNFLLLIEYSKVKEMNIEFRRQLFSTNREYEELNKAYYFFTETTDIEFNAVELRNDIFYLFIPPKYCFSCLEKSLWDINGFLRDINQKVVIVSSGWNAKKINEWVMLDEEEYFSILDSEKLVLGLPLLITSSTPCFFKVNENRIKFIHHFNLYNIEKTYKYLQNH